MLSKEPKLKEILLKKLDSFLNPKLETRIIWTLFTLGAFLVGGPPFIAAAVLTFKYGDSTFFAEISNGSDILSIILGVLFLVVALYLFERKRKREETQDTEKVSVEDDKDKKTVLSILVSINTKVIDNAIERGRLLQFYDPVLHYYYGVKGLAESSSFMLYNEEIRNLFEHFYRTYKSFISHGAHFTQTSHPDLHRFVKSHEIGDWKKHEEYQNSYLSDVKAFDEAYRLLIGFVKRKYPDIDLAATNRAASDDYARNNAEWDKANKAITGNTSIIGEISVGSDSK